MTINTERIPAVVVQATHVDAGLLVHSIYYNQEQEIISTDTIFLAGKYSVQTSMDAYGYYHRTIIYEYEQKKSFWKKLKTKITNLLNKEIRL